MTRALPWRVHGARLLALLALSLGRPSLARADAPTPVPPSQQPIRDANFAWTGDLLRATFSFSDVLDPAVRQKLSNGPSSTIVMRAAVLREGETTPVSIVVQQCVVSYDLWADAYKVQLTNASGTSTVPVANLNGVERKCARAQDLPITSRATFKAGVPYFLYVVVDVNPVSDEVRAQMRQWVQRPVGPAEVGPGDAVFSAFVLLLFRDVGGSDRTLTFRTRSFMP